MAPIPRDPRTLVIVAHPDLGGTSRVNLRWVRELEAHPDEFAVRDLYGLYPAGTIDEAGVAAEREALEAHDLIVFQFPVYWYSCPALLRTWTDEVYGLGWAYGGERALPGEPGRMLANKRFAVAMSAGDTRANYCAEGTVGFTPDQVIAPFRATATYVGASCEAEPFALFGAELGLTDAALERSAADYVAWLRRLRA